MKNWKKLIIFSSLFIISCSSKPQIEVKEIVIEKPVYIKLNIPELPKKPKLENVKWIKIGKYYCVDKNNAKKLLKNLYKLDNYARELEIVIESIRKNYEQNNNKD